MIEIIFFLNESVFVCATLSICNIFRTDNTILHETYCISSDTNDVKRIRQQTCNIQRVSIITFSALRILSPCNPICSTHKTVLRNNILGLIISSDLEIYQIFCGILLNTNIIISGFRIFRVIRSIEVIKTYIFDEYFAVLYGKWNHTEI